MKNKKILHNFFEKYKRKLALGVATICIFSSFILNTPVSNAFALTTNNNINILIEGKKLNADTTGYLKNDRALIPLRVVLEQLGATVNWDQPNQAVEILKDGRKIKLFIDNRLISYEENGVSNYSISDVAPVIINDLTYVPIRIVSNALGFNVSWNQERMEVNVYSGTETKFSSFFNIDILGVENGQVISNKIDLKLGGTENLPNNSNQIKYLFLNPTTGKGKIVAKSNTLNATTTFKPDISNQGNGILAAVVCDKNGNFLAGVAEAITINITPKVTLTGVTNGQTLSEITKLTCDLNFIASSTIYEIHYPNRDLDIYSTGLIDPDEGFNYYPETFENGEVALRVVALDSKENKYYSEFVNINVAAKEPLPQAPYVNLKAIETKNLGIIPVNLSVSKNFYNVTKTEYFAKNTATGKTVLLHETTFSDYSWFPGPDMAGTWDIYVKCSTSLGTTYTSNVRTVTVPKKESLTLIGIGPNNVITDAFSVKSISNVPIKEVSYVLSNPYNGSQKVMGISASTSAPISFTPSSANEGMRNIQAIATTINGKTIKSDVVPVKIYLGELYSSRPVVDKNKFIEYITPMALKTQNETGMSAALQIAQAILETGWGQKVPVDKYTGLFSNNIFGVKGTGNAGSVLCSTWEEYYGEYYRIDDHFRAYKTVQDSWNDHSALLLTRERYIPYTEVMFNSTSGAYALRRCGYATDSKYPGKLIDIIERYNLDKLDEQKI